MARRQTARRGIHVIDADYIKKKGQHEIDNAIHLNWLAGTLGQPPAPLSPFLPPELCREVEEARNMVIRTYEEAGDGSAPFIADFKRNVPNADAWLNVLALSKEALVIARVGDAVAGTVHAGFRWDRDNYWERQPVIGSVFPQTPDHAVYIGGAFVTEPYRRNGLFRRMFGYVERWMLRQAQVPCCGNILEIANTHPATPQSGTIREFLEKNGFQPLPGYLTENEKRRRPELAQLDYFGKMVTVSSEL